MQEDLRKSHIINSKKHTIEFVDTDGIENLKIAHYSGGYKEFTNFANIEFAPEQDQKLVIGDQFTSVNSDKHDFVGMNRISETAGDEYENIGESDRNVAEQIKVIIEDIHQYSQLFDVRRVRAYTEDEIIQAGGQPKKADSLPNFISPLQTKQRSSSPVYNPSHIDERGHFICPKCKNNTEPEESNFNLLLYLVGLTPTTLLFSPTMFANCMLPAPALIMLAGKSTINLKFPSPFDIQIGIALSKFNNQPGYFRGAKCDICNSDLLFVPDKKPGWSPSSFGGEFEVEARKLPGGALEELIIEYTPQLINLEKRLSGGDKIVNIGRNKIEKIGPVMNDLPSIRVDPIGKLRTESVYVSPGETYVSFRPSPHVESVDVLNMPGGDYILTAGNKYKLLVGAKGINMKTFGPLDMYGTLVNFTGQQINISSQYETNLDGGDRINLRARKISFTPKEHSPVIIDGALHVARNMIVRGGGYFDGQLAAPAFASVKEIAETSDAVWLNNGITSSYIACGKGFSVIAGEVEVAVVIPPHKHLYDRPASQLFNSIEALRAYVADPEKSGQGGGGGSINDVLNVTAAAAVNNSTLGEGSFGAQAYASSLQTSIRPKLLSAGVFAAQIGSLNVQSADVEGTNVTGSLGLNISPPSGSAQNSKWGPGSYKINYNITIDPETKQFVEENRKPTIVILDGNLPSISI